MDPVLSLTREYGIFYVVFNDFGGGVYDVAARSKA
jgi:hypothetical protein